jgi:glyoxylase-like metal-dependent hydrolase (beta-lactamase superfamily II)
MARRFSRLICTLLTTCLLGGTAQAQSDADARKLVGEAATALGGAERIRSIKNVTLIGYGQWAYQFGGGNITGDPNAPQKYQAANDLRRVYDLENGRFQQLERRNFLFPFAGVFGHAFAPVNLVLDGDVAYDIAPDGKKARIQRWIEGVLHLDGVHMRRMWMHNNPVVAVRSALDPATKLSNVRQENGVRVVDLTLKEGNKMTLAIDDRSRLPSWVRWSHPHSNLGQVTLTTYFSGYAPYGGVLMPLGYNTRLDWRNVDYFKLYVDNYLVDTQIADLAAPAEVRSAPEPQPPVITVEPTQVAPHVWRLKPYGSHVIEFEDHLVIYELGGNQAVAKATIDAARKLVPNKPLTHYIPSHHHWDHTAGFRVGIAEGLAVISRRGNEQIFREMAEHRAPDFPDALEKSRQPFKFIPMDEHLRLSDSLMTVDLYWARGNIHMADAVFLYVPSAKMMIEGDIATAAYDYQFWPDDYLNLIEHYKLDVEVLSPVHMQPMKHAEVIELIRGGVERARQRCADELAKGNYFAGCPVQSTRF